MISGIMPILHQNEVTSSLQSYGIGFRHNGHHHHHLMICSILPFSIIFFLQLHFMVEWVNIGSTDLKMLHDLKPQSSSIQLRCFGNVSEFGEVKYSCISEWSTWTHICTCKCKCSTSARMYNSLLCCVWLNLHIFWDRY